MDDALSLHSRRCNADERIPGPRLVCGLLPGKQGGRYSWFGATPGAAWHLQQLSPGESQTPLQQGTARVAKGIFRSAIDRMVAVGSLQAGNLDAEIVELHEVPHLQLVAA